MAMLIAVAIPSSAASETASPYIEIEQPVDGSTVGTNEVLVVVAEGTDLRGPTFSIEGEQIGVGGPLTGCIFEGPVDGGSERMYCKYALDLSAFDGQKVRLSVSVQDVQGDAIQLLTDSVGLLVSGHCA
jgi:hypothetical protein